VIVVPRFEAGCFTTVDEAAAGGGRGKRSSEFRQRGNAAVQARWARKSVPEGERMEWQEVQALLSPRFVYCVGVVVAVFYVIVFMSVVIVAEVCQTS
jgi:hypothetical protein